MGNLAAGVNKMAELQAKRLKLQEESKKERKMKEKIFLSFVRTKPREIGNTSYN